MISFEEEVAECLCDPAWEGIPTRDAVMFIANLVKDPAKVRDYIARGISAEQAGDIELEI